MILTYKEYDIYYETLGNKANKPIIILNGIMMSTKSWDIFNQGFKKNNYLIKFDMIDQGQSSKATTNYTQELQIEILKALIEELGLPTVNLLGISYGASIALNFAATYPSLVTKLVLANGVAKTSPWLKSIGDGWNEVAKSRNGLAYYNITIPYIYSPMFYTKNIGWMEKRKELLVPIFSNAEFLDSMIRLTKSAETHDVIDKLSNVKADTLIISSEQDFLTPPFEQTIIKEHINHSKLIVIPNCGHASMYEVPTLFSSLVLGHINDDSNPKVL